MAQVLFCVDYILSEKLCQDPLESFFGKQRAAGGRNDNPTVQQFCKIQYHYECKVQLPWSLSVETAKDKSTIHSLTIFHCQKDPETQSSMIVTYIIVLVLSISIIHLHFTVCFYVCC